MSDRKQGKVIADNELFGLLNLNPYKENDREKLDADAVIKAVQQNPQLATVKYKFSHHFYPLHQAIILGASIDVVMAIYNAYPQAIRIKCYGLFGVNCTVLHLSLQHDLPKMAPIEVISFLISKWPGALREELRFSVLHHAVCHVDVTCEVLTPLLNSWPNGAMERNFYGNTPLHEACYRDAPYEVVYTLYKSWPGAAEEKNRKGDTPLHIAVCSWNLSLKIVSLLLDHDPNIVKEKNYDGCTPLHCASIWFGGRDLSLDLFLTLLEKWPEAIIEKDRYGKLPRQLFFGFHNMKGENGLVKQVVSFSHQFFGKNKVSNDELQKMMDFYIQIEWRTGIQWLLDKYPTQVKHLDLDVRVFPQLFYFIGKRCKRRTLWTVVRNELDIMEGVVYL